jgi:chemotaxis protein methyltransferase CheR
VRYPIETEPEMEPLAPREFEQIRQLAYRTFGLDLTPGKEELVAARLRRLAKGGGHRRYMDYYKSIVADKSGQSLIAMIDALATNHTSFMREPEHFDFLRREVMPQLGGRGAIEIWSAACSTGEEVWTIAMSLLDVAPALKVRLSASDISSKALKQAEAATYPKERCLGIPPAWLGRYFRAEPGLPAGDGHAVHSVIPGLRALATFRRINLVQPYSWPRLFPVIFCRNVMIYFDHETQERVVRQLAECLEPGGYLFVGHAESLTRIKHPLECIKPAVYRKPGRIESRWNRP